MLRIILVLITLIQSANAMNFFQRKTEPKFKKIPKIEAPQVALPCIGLEQQIKENMFYCPQPEQLYADNNIWKTNYGWKSYEVSFTKKISRFVGAQWQGVNVGRITCLYQGIDTNDFPVQISTNSLIHAPDKPLWNTLPSGIHNCVSVNNSVCDCPFSYVKTKKDDNIKDIIKSLK